MNKNYAQFGIEPLDFTLRNEIGISVEMEDIPRLNETVERLLNEKDIYRAKIESVVSRYLYNPGRSGEAGGRYIIKRLTERSA
jgi:YidC/Oxa1 family membrane protein insertase